jgi:hypothetical protein
MLKAAKKKANDYIRLKPSVARKELVHELPVKNEEE